MLPLVGCYTQRNTISLTLLEVYIEKFTQLLSLAMGAFGAIGSSVVALDPATGKRSLNLGPSVLIIYGVSAMGCYLSHDEPFGQCVKTILTAFGGAQ